MKNRAMPARIPISSECTIVRVLLHVGFMFDRALVIHDADRHRVQRYIQSGVVRHLLSTFAGDNLRFYGELDLAQALPIIYAFGKFGDCAQLAGCCRSSHANNRLEAKREAVLFARMPYA